MKQSPNSKLTKKLLFESLFVGVYTCVISIFVSFLVSSNFVLLLFVVGFLKHFLGYYLKIQDYYCATCVNGSKSYTTKQILLGESILEGGVFIILGLLLKVFIENRWILMFLLGFLLHMTAEFVGVHKYFCKNRCVIQRRP
jgi:hypothetical protein|uniref:Uncharacterized protein n=1 Tax=viral metagenome TaxID=1070528 RepID=A0A6C0CWP1_9ZZZZ